MGPRPKPAPAAAPAPAVEPAAEPAAAKEAEPKGRRPYELEWNPRVEAYDPLIDFEFLLGWEAVAQPGTDAAFERSAERTIWGRYAGKLTYGGPAGGVVDIRPPEPLEIRDRIDTLQLWVHGPPDVAKTDGPRVTLMLDDAAGRRYQPDLGIVDWEGWNLLHRRLPAELLAGFAPPLRLLAIRWTTGQSGGPATYYIDSLSAYTERHGTLNTPPCPMPPGTDAAVAAPPVEAVERARGQFELRGGGAADGLVFAVDAATLGEGVAVSWNGVYRGHLLAGLESVPSQPLGGPYQVARLEKGGVYIEYASGLVCSLHAAGATLSIQVEGRGEEQRGLRRVRDPDVQGLEKVEVPGLTDPAGLPVEVGWIDGGESNVPLFVCTRFDWDRSAASEFDGLDARYRPASDGAVHRLAETVELTVSPRLEDVLPRTAAPAGTFRDALRDRIWVDSTGPADYAEALAETGRLAALGIREVAQGHLANCWRDREESCTLRDHAAPGKGGDEALTGFLAEQRGLGWMTGLWVDYLQVHPLNAHWSARVLQRTPAFDWVPGIPGHYLVKPIQATAFQAELAPRIRDRFAPALAYIGGTAADAPWIHTDYDAGAPGAGQFDAAYRCIAQLLRTESDVLSGPVVGDGGAEVLYAGYYDGYLVRDRRYPRRLLPAYVLDSLQPRAIRFGAGDQLRALPAGLAPAELDRELDRFLAYQIAFGAAGRLAPPSLGEIRQCRSYYLMIDLQPRYLSQRAERISYWNGSAYLSASQAITSGAIDDRRLYVRYGEDTELWVNGHDQADWTVRVGANTWTLPPFGWVVAGPEFLELSAAVDGRRMDYVTAGPNRYLDGRGTMTRFRELASSGPLALRIAAQEDGFRLAFTDLAGTGRFGFALPGSLPTDTLPVEQYDAAGTLIGPGEAPFHDGMFWIEGAAHHYIVHVRNPSPSPRAVFQ